ncbi:hypothetical protein EF847_19280 [Actinobacteria bacterium YIM 96077]|uniref:Uncharacterized protein n=1 Tax=Phytoactinopolyspora halophila TaxID=1981511 RepID=A0A329QPC9_9ACTN|nr:hypothetical protein [Phytoactinopolyspora halophila]AYY14517.1 hypothetical protein EF847_19280 [Actinobacteria bacterium YIM 96077]RAW14103.1 hypothetical protein DPM12_11850 [Phytoactinopolyspora halophila]
MPSSRRSIIAAVLAGVLALASASSPVLFAAGLAVVQVVFALGVVRASGLPSARPAAWLALIAGVGALVWVERSGTPELVPVAAVLGPTVLIAIVVQLLRRDGRGELNRALSLVVAACVLVTLPVIWVALHATSAGVHTVGFALLGVGVVALAEALPASRALRRVLGVVVASSATAVLVTVLESMESAVPAVSAVVIAAFSGVMTGVAFAMADRLAGESGPAGSAGATSQASNPDGDAEHQQATRGGTSTDTRVATDVHADGAGPITVNPATIVPMRIAGPFVAAAPTAYVLGQLLVR